MSVYSVQSLSPRAPPPGLQTTMDGQTQLHEGEDGYCIAGNFRERKLSRISRKGAFHGENFCGILKLVA